MKTKKRYATIAGLENLTPEDIKKRNLETYGLRIKKFRARAGLTAEQLAETLQISKSSVRNWECGLARPDPEYLYRMFTILNVEPNEFFGFQGIGTLLTAQEQHLIDTYRALDDDGRENLITFADAMNDKSHLRKLRSAYDRMNDVVNRGRLAAAGDGEDWDENSEEEHVVLYDSKEVRNADEIFKVSGMSMEPQFNDGDYVLVQYCEELRNGDIGIFYVPGHGGVIKQKAYDRLHSLNPDYDDIFPYEDGARIVGRVVGKITKDMVPEYEDEQLYLKAVETLNG